MNNAWLAIPVILILALVGLLFLSQPKVNPAEDVEYVDVDGDEYLDLDYISEDEIGIGDVEDEGVPTNFVLGASIEECSQLTDFEKDLCMLRYVETSGDKDTCERIVDGAIRDDCFARIASLKQDATACDKVTFGKSECYVDVAIQTSDAGLCEKGNAERDQCYQAALSGNYDACPEGESKKICNDAISEGNPELCLTGRTIESTCWSTIDEAFIPCEVTEEIRTYSEFCYYNVAVETNAVSLCNKAGGLMDTCFFKVARNLKNPNICENLSETRDNCIAWIAFDTNDRQLCFQAGSEAQSCIEDLEYEYG